MSNENTNTNTNETITTNEVNTTVTTNKITIVNIKNNNNLNTANALRAKFGSNIDGFNIFPYQNGVAPVQFKFHKDNKRLFVEYPSFMAIVTPDYTNMYLKKQGEPFPSICYKVKKANVEELVSNDIINTYINSDASDITTFLESNLTNESKVVMDNLEISVLLRILEKEKTETKQEYTYSRLFDLIRSKFTESKDCGYLEKLCKTCVMLNQTYFDTTKLEFGAIDLFPKVKQEKLFKEPKAPKEPKTVKAPKAVKAKETKVNNAEEAKLEKARKEAEKEAVKVSEVIPEFTNPVNVPVLKNVNDEPKKDDKEIDEKAVASIIDSI